MKDKQTLIAIALIAAVAFTTTLAHAADPLPSWNDGPAKQSIVGSPGSALKLIVKHWNEGAGNELIRLRRPEFTIEMD